MEGDAGSEKEAAASGAPEAAASSRQGLTDQGLSWGHAFVVLERPRSRWAAGGAGPGTCVVSPLCWFDLGRNSTPTLTHDFAASPGIHVIHRQEQQDYAGRPLPEAGESHPCVLPASRYPIRKQ